MNIIMMERRDNIYIYLWEEFNTVYIGRTVNPKGRHYAHKHRETEPTYKFSSAHHVEHPKMIIIESDLTVEEGIECEKYWIDYYKEKSKYNVLNKLKGGGVGNIDGVKWTREIVFNESKKYTSLSQFKYNNNTAYSVARLNGWLKEMTWFKRPTYITKWSKEAVFEEAKKYKKKRHFEMNSPVAYRSALKNGWLSEMDWLSKNGKIIKWTKEAVFEEAKKYNTRNSFRKGSCGAYRSALNNKWLNEMYWLKPDIKWSKKAVFEESKKYSSLVEFKKNSSVAYRVAVKNKWIKEMPWIRYKIKKS